MSQVSKCFWIFVAIFCLNILKLDGKQEKRLLINKDFAEDLRRYEVIPNSKKDFKNYLINLNKLLGRPIPAESQNGLAIIVPIICTRLYDLEKFTEGENINTLNHELFQLDPNFPDNKFTEFHRLLNTIRTNLFRSFLTIHGQPEQFNIH